MLCKNICIFIVVRYFENLQERYIDGINELLSDQFLSTE